MQSGVSVKFVFTFVFVCLRFLMHVFVFSCMIVCEKLLSG